MEEETRIEDQGEGNGQRRLSKGGRVEERDKGGSERHRSGKEVLSQRERAMERPKIPGRKKTLDKEATNSPILQPQRNLRATGSTTLKGIIMGQGQPDLTNPTETLIETTLQKGKHSIAELSDLSGGLGWGKPKT